MCYRNGNLISTACAAQSVGTANDLFASLIQTILTAYCSISPPGMWPTDYGPKAMKRSEYFEIFIPKF